MFLYIRMLLLMAIAIYTSRVVLDALGDIDFGIYNVVGGIVSMVGFLNSSMATAVQRFLSYEMGKGNPQSVSNIFSISLIGHVLVIVVVLLISEPLGLWLVNSKLDIPDGSMRAANWVLQTSILMACVSFMQVPYNAIILAREKMGIYGYISILEGVLRLAIAFLILTSGHERLIFYSTLQLVASFITFFVYWFYCYKKIPESKFHIVREWGKFKEIFSFVSFNLIGEISQVFTGQGLSIVLNMFFGPAINAARGLADQVYLNVTKFSNNFQQAITPQIVKTYSAKDYASSFSLTIQGINYSYYMVLMIVVPLFLEVDTVLGLWLKSVPPYTAVFTQIVLIASLIGISSGLLTQLVQANGNIKYFQIVCSVGGIVSLPVAWVILKIYDSAVFAMSLLLFVRVFLFGARLIMASRITGLSIPSFLRQSTWPILKVTVVGSILPVVGSQFVTGRIESLVGVTLLSIVSVSLSAFFLGMTSSQRTKVIEFLKKRLVGKKG